MEIKEAKKYDLKSISGDFKKAMDYWLHWDRIKDLPHFKMKMIVKNVNRMVKDTEETEKSIVGLTTPYKDKASLYLKNYMHNSNPVDLEVAVYLLKKQLENLQNWFIKNDPNARFVKGKKFVYKNFRFIDNYGLTESNWTDISKAIDNAVSAFPPFMKMKTATFSLLPRYKDTIDYIESQKIIKLGVINSFRLMKYLDRVVARGLLYKFYIVNFKYRQQWEDNENGDIEKFADTMLPYLFRRVKKSETNKLLEYLQGKLPNVKQPIKELPAQPPKDLKINDIQITEVPSQNLQKAASIIKESGHKKLAIMFGELLRATSWLSTKYSSPVKVKLVKSMPKFGRWTFRTFGNLKNSNAKGYLTKLKFIKKGRTRDIKKLDMKVHCTCPAYLYWGAQYNLTSLNSALEKENRAPEERDPEGQNFMCKHIYSVLKYLKDKPYQVGN